MDLENAKMRACEACGAVFEEREAGPNGECPNCDSTKTFGVSKASNATLRNGTAEDLMSRSGRHFVKNGSSTHEKIQDQILEKSKSKNDLSDLIMKAWQEGKITDSEADHLRTLLYQK